MRKILLLEDDELLGETVSEELAEAEFNVKWVKNADAAADAAYEGSFDLYLFDVNVPGQSGFELLHDLRAASDETPAIFLTARSDIKDLQVGFSAGADDYITKPFKMAELLVRINAKIKSAQTMTISRDAFLDVQNRLLVISDQKIDLPRREFEILHYYLNHKGRIIGKDEILEMLYEGDFISDATYRVYVRNINTHLGGHAKLINIRGSGYRFEQL